MVVCCGFGAGSDLDLETPHVQDARLLLELLIDGSSPQPDTTTATWLDVDDKLLLEKLAASSAIGGLEAISTAKQEKWDWLGVP